MLPMKGWNNISLKPAIHFSHAKSGTPAVYQPNSFDSSRGLSWICCRISWPTKPIKPTQKPKLCMSNGSGCPAASAWICGKDRQPLRCFSVVRLPMFFLLNQRQLQPECCMCSNLVFHAPGNDHIPDMCILTLKRDLRGLVSPAILLTPHYLSHSRASLAMPLFHGRLVVSHERVLILHNLANKRQSNKPNWQNRLSLADSLNMTWQRKIFYLNLFDFGDCRSFFFGSPFTMELRLSQNT